MRVLHVICSADPRSGGPIEGVLQQARQRSDRTVHLATLDPPDAAFLTNFPLKVFAFGPSGRFWDGVRRAIPWSRYGYTPTIVPWLRRHIADYDLVVVNGIWNYASVAARRALVGSGRPYVVFTHGMLDPWFKKTYPLKHLAKQLHWWMAEGPLLNSAQAVMFTTEDEKVLAHGAFWPYRIKPEVIAYGTSDIEGDAARQEEAFRRSLPAIGGRRYLLFLSRIHEKKGCDLLISAFKRHADLDPGLDLVIAGPDQVGLRSVLAQQAADLGIAGRIHWPGMLTGDAKWGAFRACEAFILPSHQENFGIVVAEAMAAGKPVLITDKVNIWREVERSGGGFVAPDTLAGVNDLLDRFLSKDAAERASIGQKARACFLETFEMGTASATIFAVMERAARQ